MARMTRLQHREDGTVMVPLPVKLLLLDGRYCRNFYEVAPFRLQIKRPGAMGSAWGLNVPPIRNQASVQVIHLLPGLLKEADMQNVYFLRIVETMKRAIKMIDEQYKAVIILHDCHLLSANNQSSQAEVTLEHGLISRDIVAVKIDVIEFHNRAFPLSVQRTRIGSGDMEPATTDHTGGKPPHGVRPWPRAGFPTQA